MEKSETHETKKNKNNTKITTTSTQSPGCLHAELGFYFFLCCTAAFVWTWSQKLSVAQSSNICSLIYANNSYVKPVFRILLCLAGVVSITLTPDVFLDTRVSLLLLATLLVYDVIFFIRHYRQNLIVVAGASLSFIMSLCAIAISYTFSQSWQGSVLDVLMLTLLLFLSTQTV